MNVKCGDHIYNVGRLIAETQTYCLYICRENKNTFLLQVAKDIELNGKIEKAAYILSQLTERSNYYEIEYAKDNPGKKLNYDRLFPIIVNTFIVPDESCRKASVLALKDFESVEKTVPLSNLINKDNLKISLESSAWIMGRLLKLFTLVHDCGFSINISNDNILIEPKNHYLSILDWTSADTFVDETPSEKCRENIISAASAVLRCTADYNKEALADNTKDYIKYLQLLSRDGRKSAEIAHSEFYEITHRAFGQKFYPFHTFPNY